MTTLDDDALRLMPAADQSERCSAFQRTLGVDPAGTSIAVDLLVLVETPLPWPKPFSDHQLFGERKSKFDTARGRARILACVPGASETLRVFTYWREGSATRGAGHVFRSRDELHALLVELEASGTTAPTFADPSCLAPEQAVLVCTQGSHDVCCGTEGTRFALDVRAHHPDLALFRVSHTGGHRFAPTAMTLPDGRMWSHLDMTALDAILSRTDLSVADRCRGWWGAEQGPAQVAERAIFAEVGFDLDRLERTVDVADTSDGGARVTVTTAMGVWDVDVVALRTVPAIACRAPGGLPAKLATEYGVERIHRR